MIRPCRAPCALLAVCWIALPALAAGSKGSVVPFFQKNLAR